MQVVAKTPRIDLRIRGEIPEKILRALEEEYGTLQVSSEEDEEQVEVINTDWYKEIKAQTTPGSTLRAYRENAGLTQAALGEMIGGVPRQNISGMESGHRPIRREMAKKLAIALNTSPRKFFRI